jgi:hypothetical protein
MDMGIQYFVLSSAGGADVLGALGAWPAFGPFLLSDTDFPRIREAAHSNDFASIVVLVKQTQLETIQNHILAMFEYVRDEDDEFNEHWQLSFLKRFLESIIDANIQRHTPFFIYFHEYEAELPLVFQTRTELIEHFVSWHKLTPWDRMDIEDLKRWTAILDAHDATFTLIDPNSNNA